MRYQTFVASALTALALPILMVLLSATIPARVARASNLVVAALCIPFIPFSIYNVPWTWTPATCPTSMWTSTAARLPMWTSRGSRRGEPAPCRHRPVVVLTSGR